MEAPAETSVLELIGFATTSDFSSAVSWNMKRSGSRRQRVAGHRSENSQANSA